MNVTIMFLCVIYFEMILESVLKQGPKVYKVASHMKDTIKC